MALGEEDRTALDTAIYDLNAVSMTLSKVMLDKTADAKEADGGKSA